MAGVKEGHEWEGRATSIFVGRERELEGLLAGLEGTLSGRAQFFLIGGEPGIGKSRLADELAARARDRGALVLWGRCWEAGGAPAFWPWVQSLRSLLRDRDQRTLRSLLGTGAPHLSQVLPEIRDSFPDVHVPPAIDPEAARFLLFDATATLLRNAAKAQPLVLIIEDLHAADAPSLLLLRFIASVLTDAPILVVGTYRDIELGRDHPLSSILVELTREPATRYLVLGGLTRPDVARFIELTAGLVPPEGLANAVYRETEGNPFFVGEVLRLLVHEGRLQQAAAETSLRLAIPQGLREVITRRLGHLSQACNHVLKLASVVGREFGLDALKRVSELSSDQLLEVLDEAANARVITDIPGALGRLRFAHALIGDALYDELSPTRRVRLHRQVGEALEDLYAPNPEPHLAELAHHFFEAAPAGDVDKAVQYARAAGDGAARLLAYEEAVRLYQMAMQAMDLKESPDEALRCELLLCLGDAQARAGDVPAAKQTFLSAASVSKRLKLPDALARAALGYGGRFVWDAGRGDRHLVPLLQDALSALGEGDSVLRVKVMARLAGGPLRDDPMREPRASLSQEAVVMARRLGDAATVAYALDGRYAAVWWPENLEHRLAIATELIQVAVQAGDQERAHQGYHYRCLARLELGDMAGVYADLEAQARLAEELRQPAHAWYVEAVRATLATFEGRFQEAEELIPRAFRLGQRAQGSMAGVYRMLQVFALRREQGRLAELEVHLKRVADEFPMYYVLHCALLHLYCELNQWTEARRTFEGLARDSFAALARDDEWIFAMSLLAEVAESLGDLPRAAEAYELLLPYAGRNALSNPDMCIGSVSRILGILAAMMARWEDAARHFRDALAMNAKASARPWVARTQYDYARALLARNLPGERKTALDLLTRARETCQELDMALAGKVSALLEERGAAASAVGVPVAPPSFEEAPPSVRPGVFFSSGGAVAGSGEGKAVNLERWHQIDHLLSAVLEQEAGQRASFLAKECGGDEELKRQVESLLREQEQLGSFLEHTAVKTPLGDATASMPGLRVGSYRLLRKIGQGGMGTVYLAERADEEYRKRVALKIITRGMDTDAILRRFRRERQILASLQHPNIATLLDGGTSADGLPYFVMEYIAGQPLLDYCDSHRLSVRERLTMFRTICSAVQYAHQNQVIHRDLKPGNILVNAEGVPKLVDFGIAKVLDADFGSGMFERTGMGVRPMTPEYASPEQVLGKPITAASDIYSLGVLLYELLSGCRPSLDRREIEAGFISQSQPLKPSLAMSQAEQAMGGDKPPQLARTAERISSTRGTTPAELRHQLTGDLDTIVLKAMHVEPERRYASAQELSDDLQRHLTGLPIVARKDSTLYRAGRYFRRHKASVLVASIATLSVVGIALMLRRPAPSSGNATIRSIAVLSLKNLSSDPEQEYFSEGLTEELISRLASLEGLRVISHTSARQYKDSRKPLPEIAKELNIDAVVEGSVLLAGERVRITAELIEAAADRQIWAASYERDRRDILALQNEVTREIARNIKLNLNPADRQRLAISQPVDPEAHAEYLRGRFYWSKRTVSDFWTAIRYFEKAIARDPSYANAYAGLADSYALVGPYSLAPQSEFIPKARAAAVKALEIDERLAEAHTSLAVIAQNYDWDWQTAEKEYLRAIQLNPNYATAHHWYAEYLSFFGRFDESFAEFERARQLDPRSLIIAADKGATLYMSRQYDLAIQQFRAVLDMEPNFPRATLVVFPYVEKRQFADALAEIEKFPEIKDSPWSFSWLTYVYGRAGQQVQARRALEQLEQLNRHQRVDPGLMLTAYVGMGKKDEAFAWFEKAYLERSTAFTSLKVNPLYDPLRSDPRFQELMRRVGLAQ